ncbi:ABC transporter substrate-binding protein [Halobacteriovorax marinus]|uniref:ABC transporter substrate-binding protein n=1 Tax=Halobacteriovorax marinus TaxID=97084 RepID=A0A1Y5F9K2_9BACT|nr:ABC transporter substrate-binding protein [Halobacteriovorax marinus]
MYAHRNLILMICIFFMTTAFSQSTEKKFKKRALFWIENEFSPSTLSKKEQIKELDWFIKASRPYRGTTIHVISERIDTHIYEAKVLAKAFKEITGISVIHETTGEDDVVRKIETQFKKGIYIYDAYINDSDLIGTHFRSQRVRPLSVFMKKEGRRVTLPTLDLDDFIGLKFTTGPDGILYQLPDQQFANLYWYRADWFARVDLKRKFRDLYGYELNIPVNWSAYEDIAEFFTIHVGSIDGQQVYGHMDYGYQGPSLGWRFSDAWLSMAGAGDKGLPNGTPVDEWGIRVENCRPVGASVERGGAANGPAAVYALTKFIEWLKKYAPPGSNKLNFTQSGALSKKGNIAQQIFWYTAFTSALTQKGLPIVYPDGTPKWRVAPSPHGAYWQKGMKLGYQDAGSWTFLKSTPLEKVKPAWLYAQFVVSKTVSLKKTIVGLTPIRKSDLNSKVMSDMSPRLGGLVEFYRSNARNYWTPTGTNVPDYPLMSPGWWKTMPKAITGELSPQEAMDELADFLDDKLLFLEKEGKIACAPKLNKKRKRSYWLYKAGSPKARLINEKPKGRTISFEDAIGVYK